MIFTIRLSDAEMGQVSEIVKNDNTVGLESGSDLFRLLLARENNRRKGLPSPSSVQWSGALRNGRPVTRRNTVTRLSAAIALADDEAGEVL